VLDPGKLSAADQKKSLPLTWSSRPGVMAIVMVPNCGSFT
jgi:hypothetical protein